MEENILRMLSGGCAGWRFHLSPSVSGLRNIVFFKFLSLDGSSSGVDRHHNDLQLGVPRHVNSTSLTDVRRDVPVLHLLEFLIEYKMLCSWAASKLSDTCCGQVCFLVVSVMHLQQPPCSRRSQLPVTLWLQVITAMCFILFCVLFASCGPVLLDLFSIFACSSCLLFHVVRSTPVLHVI